MLCRNLGSAKRADFGEILRFVVREKTQKKNPSASSDQIELNNTASIVHGSLEIEDDPIDLDDVEANIHSDLDTGIAGLEETTE